MLCIRPDLGYAIKSHYAVAKHVLRYLKGTFHVGITFNGSLGLILELYCDADWADEEVDLSISILQY